MQSRQTVQHRKNRVQCAKDFMRGLKGPLVEGACSPSSNSDCATCTALTSPPCVQCCAKCKGTNERCMRRTTNGQYHCFQHRRACERKARKTVPQYALDYLMRPGDFRRSAHVILAERKEVYNHFLPHRAAADALYQQVEDEIGERETQIHECFVQCADEGHVTFVKNLVRLGEAIRLHDTLLGARDAVIPRRRSKSPRRRSKSPRRRSKSPRRRSKSPRRRPLAAAVATWVPQPRRRRSPVRPSTRPRVSPPMSKLSRGQRQRRRRAAAKAAAKAVKATSEVADEWDEADEWDDGVDDDATELASTRVSEWH